MKIIIKVKPNAKKQEIEKLADGSFKIAVKEPPTENRANWAVIKLIAEHFKVAPSRVQIVSGVTSKQKVVEIN